MAMNFVYFLLEFRGFCTGMRGVKKAGTVLPFRNFLRNIPHMLKLTVEGRDLPFTVNYQDTVGGRFKSGPEDRVGLFECLFGPVTFDCFPDFVNRSGNWTLGAPPFWT